MSIILVVDDEPPPLVMFFGVPVVQCVSCLGVPLVCRVSIDGMFLGLEKLVFTLCYLLLSFKCGLGMEKNRYFKDTSFLVSFTIILITIGVSVATYFRWIQLRFQVGSFYFTHLLAWIGSLFILFYTPIYYILKRKKPRMVKNLVRLHVFGNLFAGMFIAIHFAQQLGRPADFYPELGTGLTSFIVVFVLVITGFIHRFRLLARIEDLGKFLPHENRFLHIAITLSFYLIVIIHILQNIGIL
jgi:uncharacterized membrane protein YidH (DUF202 family)